MPKLDYETWNVSDRIMRLGREIVSIANRYASQGYDLSVRQLYYQLVAADRIPNTIASYKQITVITDRLRMAGMLDWYRIVDRTRHVGGRGHWDSPDQVVLSSADAYAIDHWEDQPRRVEIWVEKEALAGVIGRVGMNEDVSYFACRGYTSTSAMWLAARRFLDYWKTGQAVTILHLGDHDPSGIDMTRDIRARLEHFLSVDWVRDHRWAFDRDHLFAQYEEILPHLEERVGPDPLVIKRIALNMDQIQAYQPPPNPAKTTDSRYKAYQELHGIESWELDALEPSILADLMTQEIRAIRDDELYQARIDRENEERGILTELVERWDDVQAFLRNES